MTGPLHESLKVGDLVEIRVDDSQKRFYYPELLLHHVIGWVWQIDEEHVWVKAVAHAPVGNPYISGPHRYSWQDITVDRIQEWKPSIELAADLKKIIDEMRDELFTSQRIIAALRVGVDPETIRQRTNG